ncbi:glycerophosphoryl diester phosphodiesterase membrane domain-containing protein [Streptomyces sp. NPDC002055]|uniref:DUF7544 domain-containing protein n=1 Tax=Streptomyces sp. NPDC002055 TaxID=3154534 RepID=UPI003331292F
MNDSPGWASPGSSPSDEPARGGSGDRPDAEGQGPSAPEDRGAPPVNWSQQQPPPGQWTAPAPPGTAPGTGGAPGWGSPGHGGPQPGWNSGWAQPPAAAKPGIIPLRPLGVGEILDGAVSTMRAHWRTVLGISLVVAVVTQTASTLTTGLWFRGSGSLQGLEKNPNPTFDETLDAVGGTLAGSGVTWLISVLGTIIATAMLTMVVSRAVLGRSVSTGDAWRSARGQLPRLFGLLFLLPLLVAAVATVAMAPGLILAVSGSRTAAAAFIVLGAFAALAAAVWIWIRYSLAAPALILERQGVIASMRRSAKLVRGAWWRIFGIQLLTLVLIFCVGAAIEIVTSIIAMIAGGEGAMDWLTGENTTTSWTFLIVVGIGSVISSTITFPISAGVTALLYMDQRIRREALDLELIRAAGTPENGPQQQPPAPQAHNATPGG